MSTEPDGAARDAALPHGLRHRRGARPRDRHRARLGQRADRSRSPIALAFLFGYAFTFVPLVRGGLALGAAVGIALAADTLSITVMEIVDNAIILAVPGAMDAGLDSLLFWGSLALALAVAFCAAYPVNRWLIAPWPRPRTRSWPPLEDVVVVGAGVMGLASAWALATRRTRRHRARAVRGRPPVRVEPRRVAHLPLRIRRDGVGRARAGGAAAVAGAGAGVGDRGALAHRACSTHGTTARRSGAALDACSAEYEVLDAGGGGRPLRHRARGRGRARAARRHRPGGPRARRVLARHLGRARRAACSRFGPARTACRWRRRRARSRPRSPSSPPAPGRRRCWPTPASSWRRTSRRRPSRTSTSRPRTPCRRSSTGTRRRAATRTRCRPARTSSRSGCTTRARRSSPDERGEPDRRGRRGRVGVGAAALSGGGSPPRWRRDVPLHEHRRRPFRDRAPRRDHRLLGVLGPRLQVRTGRGRTRGRARLNASLSF